MIRILFLMTILFLPFFAEAQTGGIAPAPLDKSVVYFVRTQNSGSIEHTTHFDSTKVIGTLRWERYLRYECEPGRHLFWVKSGNRSFIRANLEAGKIYLVDVVLLSGDMVTCVPVNSSEYNFQPIQKTIGRRPPEKFSRSELNAHQYVMHDEMMRGLNRLKKFDESQILNLGEYSVKPQDLIYVRKRKEKKIKQK